jgi:hypothetical protein
MMYNTHDVFVREYTTYIVGTACEDKRKTSANLFYDVKNKEHKRILTS